MAYPVRYGDTRRSTGEYTLPGPYLAGYKMPKVRVEEYHAQSKMHRDYIGVYLGCGLC